MRKKINMITGVLIALALVGCGGGSAAASAPYEEKYDAAAPAAEEYYEEGEAYDYDANMDMVSESMSYGTDNETKQVTEAEVESEVNSKADRMLIKNVYMNVESEDVDAMVKNVEKRVDQLGGYIESTNIENTKYSSSERKTANIIARVPVEKLDGFVDEVEGQSNVLSQSSNAEDVTLKYVDMQSKLDSYQTEYDRIYELLKKADDLDTIIALESRLTEIRYQIESYGSQLKVMKNQASYSTINLSITQVIEYTPVVVEEKTRIEQMRDGFIKNCVRVGNGILDFFVGLIVALPVLIVWAIVIGVIVFIIRLIIKKSRNKHPKKERVPKYRRKIKEQTDNTNTVQDSGNTVNTDTEAPNDAK